MAKKANKSKTRKKSPVKRAPKKAPAWKEFEKAVANFVRTLDARAVVQENAKLPDIDTGRPRQRDVIVRAVVCQQFPLTILVSCKLKKRALSEEDIDHFIGEIRSAGAQVGVIYANKFGAPAIEKACKLSVSCCKLFQNAPAELPQQLVVRLYHCRPTTRISVSRPIDPAWGDLFATEANYNDKLVPAIDAISEIVAAGQRGSITPFPDSWQEGLSIVNKDDRSIQPLSFN